ncbi:hypothetical protein P7K49_014907 [Saguinus oedipus]|uniref:Uncharacterized protein n=1 Tax=Saguinus oedipus TaxID=9490 RepID=A0ABQ9V7Q8_SAGOE|nr:hypothetical protein P7K49_014907 [Saguinus oedipus]
MLLHNHSQTLQNGHHSGRAGTSPADKRSSHSGGTRDADAQPAPRTLHSASYSPDWIESLIGD